MFSSSEVLSFYYENFWLVWATIGVAGLVLSLELWRLTLAKKQAFYLQPAEVIHKINREGAIVLDCRSETEYKTGTLVAAVSGLDLAAVKKKLGSNKLAKQPIIMLIQENLAIAQVSNLVTDMGKQLANSQIYVLAGGLAAWQQAGLPVIKGQSR